MIHELSISNLIMMLTPVCSGLFCIAMTLLRSSIWLRLQGTGMRQSLLVYYSMILFNWSMLIVLTFHPEAFIALCLPVTFSIILVPLMLYRVIFILTRIKRPEKFPIGHYIFPSVLFLAAVVWSANLLIQQGESVILSIITPSRIILFAVSSRLVFGIIYSLLSIRRHRQYLHYMSNYTSNLAHSSISWLPIFLILWILFLIIPLIPVLLSTEELLVPVILLFFQNIFLCFNIIRGNFIIETRETDRGEVKGREEKREIQRVLFETYFWEKKPYLDPNLTIVEVAGAMNSNRSYISRFINSTYGMNFSQLVNEYRLKELDRIVHDPHTARRSNIEKITLAGFGSYQSYRRALQMQEKRKTLKAFE